MSHTRAGLQVAFVIVTHLNSLSLLMQPRPMSRHCWTKPKGGSQLEIGLRLWVGAGTGRCRSREWPSCVTSTSCKRCGHNRDNDGRAGHNIGNSHTEVDVPIATDHLDCIDGPEICRHATAWPGTICKYTQKFECCDGSMAVVWK